MLRISLLAVVLSSNLYAQTATSKKLLNNKTFTCKKYRRSNQPPGLIGGEISFNFYGKDLFIKVTSKFSSGGYGYKEFWVDLRLKNAEKNSKRKIKFTNFGAGVFNDLGFAVNGDEVIKIQLKQNKVSHINISETWGWSIVPPYYARSRELVNCSL